MNSQYRIEEIVLADGTSFVPDSLPEYQPPAVEPDGVALIQAMSAFAPQESVMGGINAPMIRQNDALIMVGDPLVK